MVAACALSIAASAAGVMSAGGVAVRAPGAADSSVTHGWIVATDGRPSVNVTVLHVPPRAGAEGTGVRAADDGTLRAAAALMDMPLGVAAVGDALYLAFHGVRNQPTQHRVVSVRAVPVGAGALWATAPRGRMNEEPVLDRAGRLAGLAGTGAGVAALLVERDRPTLMMLDVRGGGWSEVALPTEMVEWRAAADASDGGSQKPVLGRSRETPWWDSPWRVVGGSRWMGVLAWRGGDEWTLWRGVLGDDAAGAVDGSTSGTSARGSGLDVRWSRIDISLKGTALQGASSAAEADTANGGAKRGSRVQFGVIDGELVAMGLVAPGESASGAAGSSGTGAVGTGAGGTGAGANEAARLHPRMDAAIVARRVDTIAAWRALARVAGVSEMATLAPLDGVGRLAIFWEDKEPPMRGEGERRRTLGPPEWHIAELSASSGEVFYQGKLRLPMAAATADYRALGVAMLVALVGAVLFVIVPIRTQDLVLPERTAMASPGRRLVATAVDAFLAMLAASVIWGVPLTQVFGVEAVVTGKVIEIVATGLAIAIPMSALMEALTGRTPGKAMVGIEVLRMSRGEAAFAGLIVRPSLLMCLVRNSIKWIMPPVAMLGLLDPELRHRGDVLTRAAVVVRYEEEGEDSEPR